MLRIQHSSWLRGTITVSGSKNAALPLIAANYLIDEQVTLTNEPWILDVKRLHEVAQLAKEVSTHWRYDLTDPLVQKMRASILLIPVWLRHFWTVKFIWSGWCKLGKRSLDTFDQAFEDAGVTISDGEFKTYTATWTPKKDIILNEFSVTTAEALITYLAFHNDISEVTVRQIPVEPHVINLIDFLRNAGADITQHYDNSVTIRKATIALQHTSFGIVGDYLEAGLFCCLGAAVDDSNLTITWLPMNDLHAMFNICRQIGINYEIIDEQTFRVDSKNKANYQAPKKLESRFHPWFATDMLPKFVALLTQCHGVSKVFETLFEGRFAYLAELQNLGAQIEMLNPHQALVLWPTPLKWWYVASTDIRGGGAMLVAGTIAAWETIITNEEMIHRGYDNIVNKMQSIGIHITSFT